MDLKELERKPAFRRAVWKRHGYLLLAVLLQLMVLGVLASVHLNIRGQGDQLLGYGVVIEPYSLRTWLMLGSALALQLGLAYWGLRKALTGLGMIELHPKDCTRGRSYGGLKGSEIVTMVQEQAQALGVGSIARVVLAEQPEPNAFTARLPGVGNVVVVYSNLLEILPRGGIQAVIAHEVAHIRRRDSLIHQLAHLPWVFAWLVGFLTMMKLAAGLLDADGFLILLQRLLFCALAIGLTFLAFRLVSLLAGRAARQAELIADAYAAAACGWLTQLNSLLLTGQRAEAVQVLAHALNGVVGPNRDPLTDHDLLRIIRRFPPRELDERVAREAAARLFIEDRLAVLRDDFSVPLTDEQIADLAARAAGVNANASPPKSTTPQESGSADVESMLLNWRKFDLDVSGHLDGHEAATMVAALQVNPRRMLFRDVFGGGAGWQTHPTMRDRVLHLHDLFAG